MVLLAFTLVTFVLLVSTFALLFRGLLSRVDASECTAEWLSGFNLDVYRPMERLLNQGDYTFLAAQPGFDPVIARRLRAERRLVFQAYLRQLIGDYKRFVMLANMMIVFSPVDRPEFAKSISLLRRQFYLRVVYVHLRITFAPATGDIKIRELLANVAMMRDSLYQLVPDGQAA